MADSDEAIVQEALGVIPRYIVHVCVPYTDYVELVVQVKGLTEDDATKRALFLVQSRTTHDDYNNKIRCIGYRRETDLSLLEQNSLEIKWVEAWVEDIKLIPPK